MPAMRNGMSQHDVLQRLRAMRLGPEWRAMNDTGRYLVIRAIQALERDTA